MKLPYAYSYVATNISTNCVTHLFKIENRNNFYRRKFCVQKNAFLVWPKEVSEGFLFEVFKSYMTNECIYYLK